MINYGSACKKLDELLAELLEKGLVVPEHIPNDLSAARKLINLSRAGSDPSELDLAMGKSPFLQLAEMNLLTIAEEGFGKEYAEAWQKKIIEAYKEEDSGSIRASSHASGIPKNEYWIRIQASEVKIDNDIDKWLGMFHLSARPQEDGYLLIHGAKEDVKSFLKEVRREVAGRKEHE